MEDSESNNFDALTIEHSETPDPPPFQWHRIQYYRQTISLVAGRIQFSLVVCGLQDLAMNWATR